MRRQRNAETPARAVIEPGHDDACGDDLGEEEWIIGQWHLGEQEERQVPRPPDYADDEGGAKRARSPLQPGEREGAPAELLAQGWHERGYGYWPWRQLDPSPVHRHHMGARGEKRVSRQQNDRRYDKREYIPARMDAPRARLRQQLPHITPFQQPGCDRDRGERRAAAGDRQRQQNGRSGA